MEDYKLIYEALNNHLDQNKILNYLINNGADEQLLQKLGLSSNITGSKIINAGLIDWIENKCHNNKSLLIGVIALMISSGQLFGYTVQSGDNLWNIAKKSKCKVEDIQKLNPQLKNKDLIKPGDKLVLPNEIKNDNINQDFYIVQKGDNFSSIAKKFNISLNKLKELNPHITNINKIKPGDKIYLIKNNKIQEPVININNNDFNIEAAAKALRQIQSNNGSITKDGDNGKAVGDYQLWEIFVKQYHRLGGNKDYQCHVINGKAQADDVRRDSKKSKEMVEFVLTKLGYNSMQEVIRGYKKQGKSRSYNIAGWNSKCSDATLQKYIDAYNKYNV